MSTRRAEMIKMINPGAPDSGFDSGSSPELFNQHHDHEGPMSRTAQYRKVSFSVKTQHLNTFSRVFPIIGYEAPFGTKKTCTDQ